MMLKSMDAKLISALESDKIMIAKALSGYMDNSIDAQQASNKLKAIQISITKQLGSFRIDTRIRLRIFDLRSLKMNKRNYPQGKIKKSRPRKP